jgi:hypothetical protein
MKAALYGFRKIIVFTIATAAMVYGLHISIDILKVIDKDKATQAASIVGAFFLAFGTVFGTLMSAFKGAYAAGSNPMAPPAPLPPQGPPVP